MGIGRFIKKELAAMKERNKPENVKKRLRYQLEVEKLKREIDRERSARMKDKPKIKFGLD